MPKCTEYWKVSVEFFDKDNHQKNISKWIKDFVSLNISKSI